MILSDIEIHTDLPDIKSVYHGNELHLCDLFLRSLNGLTTPSTKKLVIVLQKAGVDLFVKKQREKAIVLLDIIEFYKDFDSAKYEQADISEKKEILWAIIFDSILSCARQLNWNIGQIENAYRKGLELKLENSWVHTDRLASKDKQLFATVTVHFDFYAFKVFVDIRNTSGVTVVHRKVIDRAPDWGWYSFKQFDFSKWTSAREFCLGLSKEDPNKIVVGV